MSRLDKTTSSWPVHYSVHDDEHGRAKSSHTTLDEAKAAVKSGGKIERSIGLDFTHKFDDKGNVVKSRWSGKKNFAFRNSSDYEPVFGNEESYEKRQK